MQCRSYAAQLGRLYDELQSQQTDVLVIGGGKQAKAEALKKSLKLPYPVLADSDRSVYLSYGLDKAILVVQRSASILVDKQGVVRYFNKVANPNNSVNKDELLQAVADL